MQKFGFVFPGQGSQKLGMLSELGDKHEVIKQTFAEASKILDIDLWEAAQQDSNNILDKTHITQPVLLASSVAIWRLWSQYKAPQPSILAGHSLGEYSALVCAGVLNFTDTISIVNKRGTYMQAAVPTGTGKMAAIVGLDNDKILSICAQLEGVSAANFNSHGQTVIAGTVAAVDLAMQACKEAGAKRALPLKVSVPSHCELMKPAALQLEKDLNEIEFRPAKIALIQNVNAELATKPEEIKQNLLKQLYEPVQWVATIERMQRSGVSKLIECGPGKVLCGLIKRIEPDIACFGSETEDSFKAALQEVTT